MLVVLTQDISFTDFNCQQVFIPINTMVYLDAEQGIAFFNDLHFDLFFDEYKLIH